MRSWSSMWHVLPRMGPADPDPFAVLGLLPTATAADVAAARRRLARAVHPDTAGGELRAMQAVNVAAEQAQRRVGVAPTAPTPPTPEATFSVEHLPVEACQRLLAALATVGEVLVADEPYRIEGWVAEPGPCFVVLDLVPEAGGSIVTVTVSPATDDGAPDANDVAAALLAEADV